MYYHLITESTTVSNGPSSSKAGDLLGDLEFLSTPVPSSQVSTSQDDTTSQGPQVILLGNTDLVVPYSIDNGSGNKIGFHLMVIGLVIHSYASSKSSSYA